MRRLFKILKFSFYTIALLVVIVFIVLQFGFTQRAIAVYVKDNILSENGLSAIEFERLKIGLNGKVSLFDLVVPSNEAGNVLTLSKLKVKVSILALLKKEIKVRSVVLSGVNGSVYHYKNDTYNFSYLIPDSKPEEKLKEKPKDGGVLSIEVHDVELEDIQFRFHDSISQVFLDVDLGYFNTNLQKSDIAGLILNLDKIKLEETKVQLAIDENLVERIKKKRAEEALLPVIHVGALRLDNVEFLLNDLNKDSYLNASVNRIRGRGAIVDISKELVQVETLELRNSIYTMDYTAYTNQRSGDSTTLLVPDSKLNFSGDWTIQAKSVKGKNNAVVLHLKSSKDTLNVFNATNFGFDNIDFNIKNTTVESEQISSEIAGLSCIDANGFVLNEAEIAFTLTENFGKFLIGNFKTAKSDFQADIDLDFPLQNAILSNLTPHHLQLNGEVDISELSYFIPQLKLGAYFLKDERISIDMALNGGEEDIQLDRFAFESEHLFTIQAHGKVLNYKNLIDSELWLEIDTINLSGLNRFVKSNGIKLPSLGAKLSMQGAIDSISGSYMLNDSFGSDLYGTLSFKGDSNKSEVNTGISVSNFNAFNYTGDSAIGKVNGQFEVRGLFEGSSLSKSSISGLVESLQVKDTILHDIAIKGQYSYDSIEVQIQHESDDLDIDLQADGLLLSDSLELQYYLQVGHLNTGALFLTEQDNIITFVANGGVDIYSSGYSFIDTFVDSLKIKRNSKQYTFDPIQSSFLQDSIYRNLKFQTKGVMLDMESNLLPSEMRQQLLTLLKRNMNPDANFEFETEGVFKVQCHIESPETIENYIGSVISDTIKVDSFYFSTDLQQRYVELRVNTSQFGYNGNRINNLDTYLKIEDTRLNGSISIDEFVRNKMRSNRLEYITSNEVGNITSKLTLYDDLGEKASSMPIGITQFDSIIQFGFNNDTILLGRDIWSYSHNIAARYDMKSREWSSEGVVLKHENEFIEFKEEFDEVLIKVENINLEESLQFLSNSKTGFLTGGSLSGYLSFHEHPELDWAIRSEVNISGIYLHNQPYGNLSIFLEQAGSNNYKAELNIENKVDYLNYSGSFGSNSKQLHEAKMQITDLSSYSSLIDTNIVNLKTGALKGDLTASFPDKKLVLSGFAEFMNTLVFLPSLGAHYKIANDRIQFTEEGIGFENTTIEDLIGNKLTLNGRIDTRNYKDFNYNLSVKSDYFQVLNTTIEQNENLYGNLAIRADVNLKGTNSAPKLKATIKVHDQTDVTFSLPGDDPLQSSSQDIVRFTENVETSSDSLYIVNSLASVSDSIEQVINRGNIDVLITFSPKARYKIITNPISGDFAYFGLNGALSYRTSQNGISEVTGNIRFVEGLYEMSFYEMIRKEFTIEPKSTIYFSGPLSNATLDLKAKNVVRTNSLGLMSSESIGNSPEEKALYNQRLPYELYFIVEGLLLSPSIRFDLDLPDEYKQNSPMIASKLNKLSTPEMEQERNMQVFALLVTGGFIAENTNVTSGSGASNVAESTARNSVNSILSQQLNRLTSDNIKYFDMNLGLNTYDDYARRGGQSTTDLDVQISKSLFDDRASFEMESRINLDGSATTPGQSSSNYNTDYKFYYTINEKGSIRVKAYNLSIYDLFDGDITNTGVGITFTKDFEGKKRENYVEIDSVQVNE